MKSTKTLILATLLIAALTAPAYSQVIKPDTLADLKAESERQTAIVTPIAAMYREAQDKRLACAKRMISDPLTTECGAEVRDLQIIASVMEEPLRKAVAAKETYERELRKAERNKK